MFDGESRNGILVYTVIFFFLLFSFIGFLIYKGFKEDKGPERQKGTGKTMLRTVN
ncbi:MAG: hypothetical protein LWX07_04875 [Bacteroidetes bacterium]|nr:hypothetical protein [Bacteroidota bacterium]